MALEAFKEWKPKQDSVDRVGDCNSIIASYMQQGYRLTLRQLYYQLVSRNIIANSEKEYRALGTLVSRARLAGLIDWDAIEDRVRQPWTPQDYDNVQEMIEHSLRTYRRQRWHGQDTYAELWVEKDALAGVLQPIASKYHTTLMVNRGYSSQSAMHESAQRIQWTRDTVGASEAIIFYLGDLDPSGEDMVRDIGDRLDMFLGEGEVEVRKIALTMAQVKHHKPPPNPTKLTDSRAADFVKKYGRSSWEVDALPPPVLHQLINDAFDAVVDPFLMDAIRKQERAEKKLVRQATDGIEVDLDDLDEHDDDEEEYDEEYEDEDDEE